MARVGEFYIASVKTAWERDRFAVREKMGIGLGDWRRVASANSHFQAKRIMTALTEQAKRDPLFRVDVDKEQEKIFKAAMEQHLWQQVGDKLLEYYKEQEEKKQARLVDIDIGKKREYIARQFVAGRLTIQTPRGATIITKHEGTFICRHEGGDAALTITIE